MGAWYGLRGAGPRGLDVRGPRVRGVEESVSKGQKEKRGREWWPEVRCPEREMGE